MGVYTHSHDVVLDTLGDRSMIEVFFKTMTNARLLWLSILGCLQGTVQLAFQFSDVAGKFLDGVLELGQFVLDVLVDVQWFTGTAKIGPGVRWVESGIADKKDSRVFGGRTGVFQKEEGLYRVTTDTGDDTENVGAGRWREGDKDEAPGTDGSVKIIQT